MGEIAEMMLDGTLDEQTGEYIGPPVGYPRTRESGHYNSMKNKKRVELTHTEISQLKIRAVRRELAFLIRKTKAEYPDENENVLVNKCRSIIKKKYGAWRERGLAVNQGNQWTEENNPDWWDDKLQRIMQPGMGQGGEHLVGKHADVNYRNQIYPNSLIISYSGKRGKKRYKVKLSKYKNKEVNVKFSAFVSFNKTE